MPLRAFLSCLSERLAGLDAEALDDLVFASIIPCLASTAPPTVTGKCRMGGLYRHSMET